MTTGAAGGRAPGAGSVAVTAALSVFLLGLSLAGFWAVRVAERDRLTAAALQATFSLHDHVRIARPAGPEALQDVVERFEADSVVSVAIIGPGGRVVAGSDPAERGLPVVDARLHAAFATGDVQAGGSGDSFEAFVPVRHLRGLGHRWRKLLPMLPPHAHDGPPGDGPPPPDPWGPGFGDVVVRIGLDAGGSWLWTWVFAQGLASAAVVAALWIWLARSRRTAALLAAAESGRRRREVLARLGEVSAVLAHEIRNPIAAAKGQVQLAAEAAAAGAAGPAIAGRLEVAVAEVGRVEALVRGLLDYARDRPLRRAHVTVREVVEGALAHAVAARGRVEIDGALDAALDVDGAQLGRALANVVANAVEAAGDVGRVRVEVSEVAGAVGIAIEDSGPGLPDDLADRVFDPFVTGKVHGVGLGLAVARDVVEAHGGTLTAGRSVTLGGARFEFTLPRGGS
jgi:signal transduction histidine kinase